MLGNWKSRFGSLMTDDARNGRQAPLGANGEPQVSTLKRVLEELRPTVDPPSVNPPTVNPSSANPPTVNPLSADPPAIDPPAADPAPKKPKASAPESPVAHTDQAFDAASRFITEHRQTAEALLRDFAALEERVKSQAEVDEASRQYASAQQKASDAAAQEHQAQESAEEAFTRYHASIQERKKADSLVEPARADSQAAKERVSGLERQLKSAQQIAAQKSSALEEREGYATKCADDERATASENEQATQRVAACEAARVAAEKDVQAARERADALKAELGTQSYAQISDVRQLAARLAEAAAAITNGSTSKG